MSAKRTKGLPFSLRERRLRRGMLPPQPFRQMPPTAEQIIFFVGYGIYDVPHVWLRCCPTRSISHCRGRRPDDPQNDGRCIDRKCRIGNQRSCHAVRRQAPYPTKRTSPLQPLYCDQRTAAGAPRRSPKNPLQRPSADVKHACSNAIPYTLTYHQKIPEDRSSGIV